MEKEAVRNDREQDLRAILAYPDHHRGENCSHDVFPVLTDTGLFQLL